MPKGFPSDLAEVFRRKLRALAAATDLEDLRQPPGNRLEALAGQVCDALVQTLLTTRDAVELQRTEILVHELNCDVSHRAGPVLYRQLLVTTGQG